MLINKLKTVSFALCLFFCLQSLAQDHVGALHIKGHNFYNNKPLHNTTIKVKSGETIEQEFSTKQSHNFVADLAFGKIYNIYLVNEKTQTMFLRVNANIPNEKRHYDMTYEIEIPFFPKDASIFDTTQFKKPFHQILFDGKNRFVDDTTYMNNFLRNIYKIETKDTTETIVTPEKIKEYVQLAGKLKLDNDKQTILKNKTISITNKKGDVIAKSQTTENGTFVFQNIDINDATDLNIVLSENDNPTKAKIKLLNSTSETIELCDNNSFKNTDNKNILRLLIDKDYKYSIAGKLVATNGNEKKIAAEKTVYLLSNKNNVVQKVKTNALGNFLFTKIVPGLQYSIAYDSAEVDPNFTMNLYSVKDKFIRRLDSVSNYRFIYKFLSVSGSGFNDLIIDDSELKMNVKGKLYGDNKNNPLNSVKVLLLNDKYETIDTATTSKNGDFLFKNVSYTKQFLISADDKNSILEAFNNILVYDNEDNLMKLVSLVKGNGFKYKPLATEQSKLSDIYIDDPWMAAINRTKGKTNETIIENVLFEFNKSDLLQQSQQTLDKIIIVMNANLNFNVELSAHSDSKGSDAYNLKLSEQRANSAKNYIINKGIDTSRIKAIGYGESKLLNNCGNTAICSDDEHALNRRLEFKLIFN